MQFAKLIAPFEVLAITPRWNVESLKVCRRSRAAWRENCCDTADLRPEERAAIQYAIEARGRWLRERRIPS